MGTKVRILVATSLDGTFYQPNDVVEVDGNVAKALAANGQADANKDAVAYCVNELGVKPVVHEVPQPAAEAATGEQTGQ